MFKKIKNLKCHFATWMPQSFNVVSFHQVSSASNCLLNCVTNESNYNGSTPCPSPSSYTFFLPLSGHPSSCPSVAPALGMSTLFAVGHLGRVRILTTYSARRPQMPSPGLWALTWFTGPEVFWFCFYVSQMISLSCAKPSSDFPFSSE